MTFYYKTKKVLLNSATAILLQNATKVNYKLRRFYYKTRSYYKMCWFKEIGFLRNLQPSLTQTLLLTSYQVFIRPHLGYRILI